MNDKVQFDDMAEIYEENLEKLLGNEEAILNNMETSIR